MLLVGNIWLNLNDLIRKHLNMHFNQVCKGAQKEVTIK